MLFTETANVLPAWNNSKAYSANCDRCALAMPVFKRLSATISAADNFLNDPAAFYKKELLPVHHRRHLRSPVMLFRSRPGLLDGPGRLKSRPAAGCSNG